MKASAALAPKSGASSSVIPIHIAELKLPSSLTVTARSSLVRWSGTRIIGARLLKRGVVLVSFATKTLKSRAVSNCIREIGIWLEKRVKVKVIICTTLVCTVVIVRVSVSVLG